MVELPSGTVTFLFTDIEGSTARWESNPDRMRSDLAQHNAILDEAMAENGGSVFKRIGDAYCVAFANPEQAANAALLAQARLSQACPGLKVRMGLHTGSIDPTAGDYYGQTVNRVARIAAIASGGQVLASDATKLLLPSGMPLRNLGRQVLKDLMEPTGIWQVGEGDFKPLQGFAAVLNNLPLQTTSFVGRQEELASLKGLLSKSRLVTLTGTGGTGKSRLSLQFVAENVDHFPDGVWFVELAALPDREDVWREVITTVGVPEGGGEQSERLSWHLAHRTSCLILDNCEHVLAIASDLAELLVRSCPNLTVIATSREPLGAAGEAVFRVPSLLAPDLDNRLSLRDLEQFGACALFVERLATSAPQYRLQESDALTIARISTRLDGIPLALELAAARGRAMPLEQIEKRLDDRFRLLTGGTRNALSRQQTLQALIDWSVQLLTEPERNLFASLSVFAGGWLLEGAESVCGGEALGTPSWEVLDGLTALVDKSLVIFDPISGRYKMLESLRQYATEMMARSAWGIEIRDRHAAYYLELADPKISYVTVLPIASFEVFVAEYENVRAAFEWSRGDPVQAANAARVASALWPGFMNLERSAEVARQLEPLIEAAAPVLTEGEKKRLLITLAVAYARSSDSRALGLLEGLRDSLDSLPPIPKTQAAISLAYSYFRAGRPNDSIAILTPFLNMEAGVDNQFYSYVFTILGLDYASLGNFNLAEELSERACLELLLRNDHRGWAAAKVNLAMIAVIAGKFRESVRHAMELNSRSLNNRLPHRIRLILLSALGAAALAGGETDIAYRMIGGGLESAPDWLDTNDQLDSQFDDHMVQMVSRAVDPDRLRRMSEVGRRHDWGPWFQAIAPLDPELHFVDDLFVVPFPELTGND